jgi:serine/threonine protein kinase
VWQKDGPGSDAMDHWGRLEQLFKEALKLPPADRDEFLTRACPSEEELRREVEGLLSAHARAEDFIETPALNRVSGDEGAPQTVDTSPTWAQSAEINAAADLPADEGDRYQIAGEHARGGLGRILNARDLRLRRPVAVKELLGSGSEAEARFIREALITARLQHPSIVPVYDLARNSEGKPFYSMKMVAGRSLAEALAEKKSLEQRLSLLPNLIAIADAMAYAHEEHVIHRDLKPSNVLIGPFGETMVIDWGLATDLRQPHDRGTRDISIQEMAAAGLTTAGTILGTPEYMPVEQAEGKPVDARADVYAIGAILYQILSGIPPYRGTTPKEVLASIRQTDPAPVEKLEPGVPRELATIARKSMARDPKQRYPSAKELAEDLRRFQTGQLVSAYSYSGWELVRRWTWKHRAGVAAVALILLTMVAGLLMTSRQARVAQSERARAERSLSDVRHLANSFMFEFNDAITNLPGSTPARALVVKRAREYLERLASEPSAGRDRALQEELATSYERLGRLQGMPGWSNLGDSSGAVESFQRAMAIRTEVAAGRPDDIAAQSALASTHIQLGRILATTGKHSEGRRHADEALRLAEALYARAPEQKEARVALIRALDGISQFYVDEDDIAHVIEYRRRVLDLEEQFGAAQPERPDYQRSLALASKRLGAALEKSGDLAGAIALYRKALALDEKRVKADKNDASALLDLSYSYGSIGLALYHLGDTAGGLDNYSRALQIREAVARADPSNVNAQAAIASALSKIGLIRRKLKDWGAALEAYQRATAVWESMSAADSNSEITKRDVAAAYQGMGELYLEWATAEESQARAVRSRLETAQRWLQRSLVIFSDQVQRKAAAAAGQARVEEVQAKLRECEAALALARSARPVASNAGRSR